MGELATVMRFMGIILLIHTLWTSAALSSQLNETNWVISFSLLQFFPNKFDFKSAKSLYLCFTNERIVFRITYTGAPKKLNA